MRRYDVPGWRQTGFALSSRLSPCGLQPGPASPAVNSQCHRRVSSDTGKETYGGKMMNRHLNGKECFLGHHNGAAYE